MITIALLVDALSEPFIALLADRVGYLRVSIVGMVAMMLLSVLIFYVLASGVMLNIALGLSLMSLLIGIIFAPLNAYMVSLFPKQYRYSGFGMALNVSIAIFGGTTPLCMMWLIEVVVD